MDRRRFLSTVCVTGVSSLLAGCEALDGVVSGGAQTTPGDGTENATREARTTASPKARTTTRDASVEELPEARSLVVRSRIDTARSLRLRVIDDGSDVFEQEVEAAAGAVLRRRNVVRSGGRYRVLVEPLAVSDASPSSFQWRVQESFGDLEILLTEDGVRYAQQVACTPACEPVSRDGTAPSLPYTTNSTRLFDPARIELHNPTAEPRTARVNVTDGDKTVLAYTYEVPPGLRPTIPVIGSTGSYDVSVSTAGSSRQYDWKVPEQPRLFVRLGETLRVDCGRVSGTVLMQNKHDSNQRMTVTVERDEQVITERTVALFSGEIARIPDATEGAGQYQVRAGAEKVDGDDDPLEDDRLSGTETDSESDATSDWFVCEGSAVAEVDVEATGLVAIETVFEP